MKIAIGLLLLFIASCEPLVQPRPDISLDVEVMNIDWEGARGCEGAGCTLPVTFKRLDNGMSFTVNIARGEMSVWKGEKCHILLHYADQGSYRCDHDGCLHLWWSKQF